MTRPLPKYQESIYEYLINITLSDWHIIWNVTQIGMTLKFECHSNWNVTQIGRLNILKRFLIQRPQIAHL